MRSQFMGLAARSHGETSSMSMGSYQASAWHRHTLAYLTGIDPHLEDLFVRAMSRAGFPQVGEAAALEAILADFLAGYDLSGARLEEVNWPQDPRHWDERGSEPQP
jgi:hypothetical protein